MAQLGIRKHRQLECSTLRALVALDRRPLLDRCTNPFCKFQIGDSQVPLRPLCNIPSTRRWRSGSWMNKRRDFRVRSSSFCDRFDVTSSFVKTNLRVLLKCTDFRSDRTLPRTPERCRQTRFRIVSVLSKNALFDYSRVSRLCFSNGEFRINDLAIHSRRSDSDHSRQNRLLWKHLNVPNLVRTNSR